MLWWGRRFVVVVIVVVVFAAAATATAAASTAVALDCGPLAAGMRIDCWIWFFFMLLGDF